MQLRKLIPTVTETRQIKQNIEQGQKQPHTFWEGGMKSGGSDRHPAGRKQTTYLLKGKNDKQKISQTSSSDKARPHTCWEEGMISRGSARHPSVTKHNHIQAESKEWQAEDQPVMQQWQNTTTYSLRARNDKQRISQTSSSDKTQPHTSWEEGMASRGLARHPAVTKHNHIQAERKEWQAEDQPDIQQGQNTTTYILRARNDNQRISQTSSSNKPQPHTSWEQGMTSRGSARHPVVTNHNHILAESKEWQAVD